MIIAELREALTVLSAADSYFDKKGYYVAELKEEIASLSDLIPKTILQEAMVNAGLNTADQLPAYILELQAQIKQLNKADDV